jgi:DNA polymerase III epsilon subunit-like protein
MQHLYGNIITAVDVETTGTLPRFHEIVQVAAVLLDSTLRPLGPTFHTFVCPVHRDRLEPKAFEVNGLTWEGLQDAPSKEKAADLFDEWYQTLPLPANKKLIPLAHNYIFEYGFLTDWLGEAGRDRYFHYHPRDAQMLALSIKDQLGLRGLTAPFQSVSLTSLCKAYGVTNTKEHDALADSLAEAELYRRMLNGTT